MQSVWLGLCALLSLILFPAAAQAQTITYSNTTTGTIGSAQTCVSPAAPLVRTFTVGTSYMIGDVDLGVLVPHGWRGDLRITLQSPAGTRVQLVNGDINNVSGNNFNVRLNDAAATLVNTDGDTASHTTTAPPYQNNFRPNAALSAFNGQNAQGTWRLEICDQYPNADDGTFTRADLYITPPVPTADLSLTKAVSNATPAASSTISYTLTVNNAASSTATATGVQVRDVLPAGFTFVSASASGAGSYNSGTGIWTVGSVAPNNDATLTITGTVNATAGASVTNNAEIIASSVFDSDSTPNNGITSEDDHAARSFTVSGTRVAGTPPTLSCPVGNTVFDWNGKTWTAGFVNNSYTVANLGSVNFALTTDTAFVSGSPEINSTNSSNVGTSQQSLFVNMNNVTQADQSTITVTLPRAVPGLQFRIFDIDFGNNSFSDKITVTGSNGGSAVTPVLTNGTANYVTGNTAIGDVSSGSTSNAGDVWVTFTSTVDTIMIAYGNHTTAPTNPGNQFASLYDFDFCNPNANLSVSKTSVTYADSASRFDIPGNDVVYTITVSNAGSGAVTNDSLFLVDRMPGQVEFFTGDANGPSLAGTDNVNFSNSGSGLTWTYATDVRFSNGPTAPTSMTQCTYTPTGTYDPAVRFICFNPKGSMSGMTGMAVPSFSISFRARIQ